MSSTATVLVHVAGTIAISQLVLRNDYHWDFYQDLNSNATGILHQTLNIFAESLSFFMPTRAGDSLFRLDTLVQAIVYLVAALYLSYLTRLAKIQVLLGNTYHGPCEAAALGFFLFLI